MLTKFNYRLTDKLDDLTNFQMNFMIHSLLLDIESEKEAVNRSKDRSEVSQGDMMSLEEEAKRRVMEYKQNNE